MGTHEDSKAVTPISLPESPNPAVLLSSLGSYDLKLSNTHSFKVHSTFS